MDQVASDSVIRPRRLVEASSVWNIITPLDVPTHIVPATLRDLSYVAAHMRPADRAEVECQLDEWSAVTVAALSLRDYSFIVELNGNPEAAFGAGVVRKGYWLAWSWGTAKVVRCMPVMTAFITEHLQPMVYRDGAQRVEARALASNKLAHRFLARIGGHRRCELPGYGKNGEDFILYDWWREAWQASKADVPLRVASDSGHPAVAAHASA